MGGLAIETTLPLSKYLICAAFKIDSIPIQIHLFKAKTLDYDLTNVQKNNVAHFEEMLESQQLGWEKYNLSTNFNVILIEGNHTTMMTDPKNRYLLGKSLTKFLV